MTKAQVEARKQLKKLCPSLYESPKKRRERAARIIALLNSPLFTNYTDADRIAGEELQKALAEAHGYELK